MHVWQVTHNLFIDWTEVIGMRKGLLMEGAFYHKDLGTVCWSDRLCWLACIASRLGRTACNALSSFFHLLCISFIFRIFLSLLMCVCVPSPRSLPFPFSFSQYLLSNFIYQCIFPPPIGLQYYTIFYRYIVYYQSICFLVCVFSPIPIIKGFHKLIFNCSLK